MRKIFLSVMSLLASYGLLLLANGLFGVLIGKRTQIEGFSSSLVGMIVSAYFLGILIGGMRSARIVAAVGHIRSFAVFASVMSTTALGLVLIVDPYMWMVLRFFAGFCMAGMIVVTESWLNERSSNKTRGSVMTLYMLTNYLAAALGALIVPLGDPEQFELFCVASIIYSLALVPVLMTRATAPLPTEPQPLMLRQLWLTSPVGLTAVFTAGSINSVFHGLGSVFADEIGLSVKTASAFISTVIIGGMVLQWPMGRLSDRTDRRKIIIASAIGTAICSFSIAAVIYQNEWNVSLLFSFGFGYGALSFILYTLAVAHTNDLVPQEQVVQTASGLLIVYGIGAVLGPLIVRSLNDAVGPGMMFLFSGSVCSYLAVFTLWRMYRRRAIEPHAREPAIVLPEGHSTSGILLRSLRNSHDRNMAKMAHKRLSQ